jgi:hypothetical protein
MCAPCKIILNRAASAAAAGENVVVAMSNATADLAAARQIPDHVLNRLSVVDAKYIRAKLRQSAEPERTRPSGSDGLDSRWIEDTLQALGEGLHVEGLAE